MNHFVVGRLTESVPRSKRLLSDETSNVFIYLTGIDLVSSLFHFWIPTIKLHSMICSLLYSIFLLEWIFFISSFYASAFCEGVVVQWCSPLTLQPEQSGRERSMLGRAPPLERDDIVMTSAGGLDWLNIPSSTKSYFLKRIKCLQDSIGA